MLAAIVAGTLAIRWPTAGIAAWAPAIGFAWFAVAQLLEGVGALGYDTIHDVRGDLALAHDVGLGASATGLVAIVLGSTVGLAVASRRHQGAARIVGAGIPVTFSSDSHAPAEVGWGYEKTLQHARDAGVSEYVTFEKRRKVRRPLPP